jgi:serine O-acetyltransferase
MYKKSLFQELKEDVHHHAGKGNKIHACLFDHRLRMLRWVRIKLAASSKGVPLIIPILDLFILRWFSSQVGNDVVIGSRMKFAHPLGIVIGKGSSIGNDCIIYQNVTLGGHSHKKTEARYPRLEDGVTIFPNSVLVGGICIGAGAIVGACSMVSRSVEPGDTVGGVPAKSIKRARN